VEASAPAVKWPGPRAGWTSVRCASCTHGWSKKPRPLIGEVPDALVLEVWSAMQVRRFLHHGEFAAEHFSLGPDGAGHREVLGQPPALVLALRPVGGDLGALHRSDSEHLDFEYCDLAAETPFGSVALACWRCGEVLQLDLASIGERLGLALTQERSVEIWATRRRTWLHHR